MSVVSPTSGKNIEDENVGDEKFQRGAHEPALIGLQLPS